MVDRAYKADLPRLRRALEELRDAFSKIEGTKTDWVKLRIDPLVKHIDSLERLLNSGEFAQEYSRLRRGTVLFHSDLVYLRENVRGLRKLLQDDRRAAGRQA